MKWLGPVFFVVLFGMQLKAERLVGTPITITCKNGQKVVVSSGTYFVNACKDFGGWEAE